MKIIEICILLGIFIFSSCQSCGKPKKADCEKQQINLTDSEDDEYINVVTINNVGDTLLRTYNTTKGTLKIIYKGDTAKLIQDTTASEISYSNGRYVINERKGNTILKKDGNIVFQRIPNRTE